MGLVQSHSGVYNSIKQESESLDILDDDCLRGICEYLPFLDLLSAAGVCIRFNRLASDIFELKYKQPQLEIDGDVKLNGNQIYETEAVLRNFGPKIHSITLKSKYSKINGIGSESVAVQMLNQTKLSSLKVLNLFGIDVSKFVPSSYSPLVNMETLRLEARKFTPESKDKIFYPTISSTLFGTSKSLFSQAFSMLKEARFKNCTGLNDAMLKNFIKMNPKLEILAIKENNVVSIIHPEEIVRSISKNLLNLVELEFDVMYSLNRFHRLAVNLGNLRQLKVLKFRCTQQSIVTPLINELIKNNVAIEHLHLISGQFDVAL